MLPDPTDRNVNPFLCRTGIRTVKKLVLTVTIHDQDVTMLKPAQAGLTIRTGLALPFEGARLPQLTETMSFSTPHPQTAAHHRCAILHAISFPVKAQVRGSWHLSLSTPWRNQGCDSPPHTGMQWPTPLSPYAYEQVHEESQGTAHAVWYDPFFSQSPAASRREKRFFPWKGTPEQPYPTSHLSFLLRVTSPIMFLTYSAWPRWLSRIIRT